MKNIIIALRERRALNCFVSGEYETALKHFLAIEKINPQKNGINHNLGLTAMALGRFEEAEKRLLIDLVTLGEFYPRLRVLADLYYLWGKREEAYNFYKKVLAASPPEGSLPIIGERIRITSDEKLFIEAGKSRELYIKGNAVMSAKRWLTHRESALDAIAYFKQAIEKDRTNLPALNNIGVIRMNHFKDYSAAAEIFREGLKLEHIDWLADNLKKAYQASALEENRAGIK